ncbi:HAT dimerization [Penicillium samsonianum]|uniref:HAT dimerization n=1 Tax=Penicillium samsonianum TaxID=1882272 RepID=UPI0025489CFF|nr:HAT dimerization [Penicillium samsonianum]KAJ6126277.1 HAT dimerization [Penicillium samsonianum]
MDSIQEVDEQREAELITEVPEAISDGEDSDDNDNDDDPVGLFEEEFVKASQLSRPSIVVSGRERQRSESVDSEDESSPPLPLCGDESGTQKRPGLREARKRGKPNDAQFVLY